MKSGLVSVVIPIYNVEKYLDRCVQSIVSQTYKNLEIILVDDGSPDDCPQKCDDWANKDARIKVIHKHNAGLGMARNTGIDSANGEYICFFDSDDYVASDAIERAYNTAKNENADTVIFGFATIDKYGNVTRKIIPHTSALFYKGADVQNIFLPDLIGKNPDTGEETHLHMSAWTELYSMNLIRESKWCFVSERDIISEDVFSLMSLYKYVKSVAIIPEVLYFYCENAASLTHSYKENRYEQIKQFYKACINKCTQLKYSQEIKRRVAYPFIANSIAAMKMIVISDLPKAKKKKMIDEIVHDETMQNVIHQISLRNESFTHKVLFFAIKKRMDKVCFWLVKAKT